MADSDGKKVVFKVTYKPVIFRMKNESHFTFETIDPTSPQPPPRPESEDDDE